MRKLLIAFMLLALLLPVLALADAQVLDVNPSKYINNSTSSFVGWVPDRFIVILKDNVDVTRTKNVRSSNALSSISGFDDLAARYGVTQTKSQFPGVERSPKALTPEGRALARHFKVYVDPDRIEEAVRAYESHPDVERVERIGIHTLYATPNDTYYDNPPQSYPNDQWHYWDTYGIEADMAWDMEAGSQTVLVGDLDIGTMYDHGDLGGSNPPGPNDNSTNGNIWINTNEVPGNNVDDDGNGYVDDILGWDFVDRTNWYSYPCIDIDCGGADNDPSDGDGHGTHTAGTIAAITNNGYSVAGVAGGFGDGTFTGGGNGVKVVPCRIGYVLDYWIYGATGVVIMDYVAEAMYYMADLKTAGWNVAAINCSFGSSNSGGLGAAADYLIAQDVVICVAAGNSNSSAADYLGSRGDCLDVGATDKAGDPASFSNYGNWVDIAAPGVDVVSTITDPANPGVDYVAMMSGTSMACPHVAGVVALLESYNPALSAADKINIITDPANVKAYNQTKNVGVGIVDVFKCLNAAGGGCDLAADFSGSPTTGCAGMTVNFSDLSTGTGIDGWSWDFGDGGTSTAQNPSHVYSAAGTYNVSLTVSSSSQGCNNSVTKNGYITVNPNPVAGFVGSPTTGTEPLTVNFTNQSTDATSYSWDFGDGGTSTATNPSYTYNAAGTYTVTLTATNSCGSDQLVRTNYITVDPCVAPTANFTGTPTSGEVPLTVNFTDQSTGGPTSWSWDFGDGGTSTAQNPSYTYNAAGTYTVTLTATHSGGSTQLVRTTYITVTCTAPVAGFVGSPTSGDYPLTVNFVDQSTGATSYSWDFGDGGTSTAANPSYTYNAAGTYTVTQTVTNSCGSDQLIRTNYITVTTPPCNAPVASFAGSPTSGNAPLTVNFTDQSTNNPTGWSWDFGDGGTSTQQNPSYTYNTAGTYSVTLTATNSCGSDVVTMTNYITVNQGPVTGEGFILSKNPDFSTDDRTFTTSETIYMKVWSDRVDFNDMKKDEWELRDANKNKVKQNLTNNFDNTHTASFVLSGLPSNATDWEWRGKVEDNAGNKYNPTANITVTAGPPPAPVADFVGSPTTGTDPLTVNFTDQSTNSPTSWNWDFGDGATSTAQNPSHTYSVGTYTVTLTVSNASGSDQMVRTNYIVVDPCVAPVANFVGSPTSGNTPLTVSFTDQSTNSPNSWNWDFGDGGTSTAQNPNHTYNTAGTYTVTLSVSNPCGSDQLVRTSYITVTDGGPVTGEGFILSKNPDFSTDDRTFNVNETIYMKVWTDRVNFNDIKKKEWELRDANKNKVKQNLTNHFDNTYTASFALSGLPSGATDWEWRGKVEDNAGNKYRPTANITVTNAVAGFSSYTERPLEWDLSNHPNPFNPKTTISFTLPQAMKVTLDVYNVLGQKVATLIDRQLGTGRHEATWDATGNSSGIYYYRLQAGGVVETRKMILMK